MHNVSKPHCPACGKTVPPPAALERAAERAERIMAKLGVLLPELQPPRPDAAALAESLRQRVAQYTAHNDALERRLARGSRGAR